MTPLPPSPTISATQRGIDRLGLERLATEFATMDAVAAETLIDSLAAQAIAHWRLDDATIWQRVKFRSRIIRATRRQVPPLV